MTNTQRICHSLQVLKILNQVMVIQKSEIEPLNGREVADATDS